MSQLTESAEFATRVSAQTTHSRAHSPWHRETHRRGSQSHLRSTCRAATRHLGRTDLPPDRVVCRACRPVAFTFCPAIKRLSRHAHSLWFAPQTLRRKQHGTTRHLALSLDDRTLHMIALLFFDCFNESNLKANKGLGHVVLCGFC